MAQIRHHTHQWIRYTIPPGKTIWSAIFRCAQPDCFRKAPRAELVGKNCICNKPGCTNEFVLTLYDLELAKPVCPGCSNKAEHVSKRRAKSLLDTFLKDGKSVVDIGAE